MTPDRYLTKQEVAEFLGLSTRMIDKLDAKEGASFPRSTRIIGRKRWLASEIKAWAESRTS